MSDTPIAIDFFCGAGGASIGLKRAGFYVVGIDIKPPSVYYGDDFIACDLKNGSPVDVSKADFLWASPPCQAFSKAGYANNLTREEMQTRHENLIPLTRNLFANHPFTCIENVEGAPLRPDLILYGEFFGLTRIRRKRVFELSFFFMHSFPRQVGYTRKTVSVCRGTPSNEYKWRKRKGLHPVISVSEKLEVMGLSGYPMRNQEVANAVPPAYSEFIGKQALLIQNQ